MMLKKAIFGVFLVLMAGAATERAFAQGAAGQRMAPADQIRVRRFIGVRNTRSATPVYQTNQGGGVKRAQDWYVISVIYDSAPDWIDDLLVQFHVLTMKPDPQTRQNVYSLFKKQVRYGDIERGRDHRAMAFLRPAAVKRYGDVVASAAILTVEGTVVDEQSETSIDLPEFWWRNELVLNNPRVELTVREGYLLNRKESPWMLVTPDDYEVIK